MTAKQMIELIQQHHPHIGETEATILLDQAKNDFGEDTGMYKSIYAYINTVAGDLLYDIPLVADGVGVFRINNVWVGDEGSEILASRLQGTLNIKDSE